MFKRKEWTMRMLHELSVWNNEAIFITLTYSDDYIPQNNSLQKAALQKFFKRLRKNIEPRKIKYFACGEYGDHSERPHYHAIVFGLTLKDKNNVKACWPFCEWQNPRIAKYSFGLAEPDSIRYVAQYIDKKFTGELEIEEYIKKNREPVFRILSQGIGKEYALQNKMDLVRNQSITMFGEQHSFPRYYLKLLDLDDCDFMKENAIEKDRQIVEYYTKVKDMSFDEFYKTQNVESVRSLDTKIKRAKNQHNKNLIAKVELKQKKL